MIETRLALPQRSPRPLMVPWTCVAPLRTPAIALATATSESLCGWIPIGHRTAAIAACTPASISCGRRPPLVSQSAIRSTPAESTARRQASANSGLAEIPSKKCSASKMTSSTWRFRYVMVSCRMSRLAWFEMRRASRTCMSQVLPTTVATGVSARSISARLRSAEARALARRVEPKAAILAWRRRSFLTSRKKAASRSLEPGHPPSI